MPDGDTKPDTNKGVVFVVVTTLAVNATIGFSTLAYCLIGKIQPDAVLLTAFISMVTGVTGVIGGMLSKTAPTETTKSPVTSPSQVHVTNQPGDPVPTTTEIKA